MISRRELLVGASAMAVLSALPGCMRRGSTVVDVHAFGATGDGTADDSQPIQAAAAAVRSGSTLYFPAGVYRFAQRRPPGGAAVVLRGVTEVNVVFAPGAQLFMDNLESGARTGTGHGILIHGPASRIALHNVDIRWPADVRRSLGDGIRVQGFPVSGPVTPVGWSGPPAAVDRIAVFNSVVRGSPQTGMIVLGASDITVAGLRVAGSSADGLHFNACRRAKIDDIIVEDAGDDGLALVTYFSPRFSFDDAAQTFSFPELTDWSNADFTIDNAQVVGGNANGIRIAGAHRVSVGSLRVHGTQFGSAVMIDSAEPGTDVGWHYVASRAVSIGNVTATDCDTGIHVLARPAGAGDGRFTAFDVQVDDATLKDCSNWSVHAESLTEHKVSGLRIKSCRISSRSTAGGNGGVGVGNAQGISLGDILIRHAEPVVAFRAVNAGQLAVDRLSVMISKPERPAGAVPPCVSLDGSDGVLHSVELGWPAAPTSWNAVRLTRAGECHGSPSESPVTIRSLKLDPAVDGSVIACS